MTHSNIPTDAPTRIARTWRVRVYGTYESSASTGVFLGEDDITIGADAHGQLWALKNGQPCDTDSACLTVHRALAAGRAEQIAEVRGELSKAHARALHITLGQLGVRRAHHYRVAMSVAARPITSLTELTQAEVPSVLAHARALVEQGQALSGGAA